VAARFPVEPRRRGDAVLRGDRAQGAAKVTEIHELAEADRVTLRLARHAVRRRLGHAAGGHARFDHRGRSAASPARTNLIARSWRGRRHPTHQLGACWRRRAGLGNYLDSLEAGDAARRGSTYRRDMDATPDPAGGAGAARVSAERAFVSDAGMALAVLNWARYRVVMRVFGVPQEQVNLLTFVLALGAADTTYSAVQRLRHPWRPSRVDSAIAGSLLREGAFAIAGPKAREVKLFCTLVALAAIGSATPGLRRALHKIHVAEQRVGQERMRFWGATPGAATRPPPLGSSEQAP
jgi:hypothetical protein